MTKSSFFSGIGMRLILGFGAVLVLLAAIAGYGTTRIGSLGYALNSLTESSSDALGASDLRTTLVELDAAFNRLSVLNTETNRHDLDTLYQKMTSLLSAQVDATADVGLKADWKALNDSLTRDLAPLLSGAEGLPAIQEAVDTARGSVAGSATEMSSTVAAMLRQSNAFVDIGAISTIQDRVLRARMLIRSYQFTGSPDEMADAFAALRDAERKFDQFGRMDPAVANHSLVKTGRANLEAMLSGLAQMRTAVTKRETVIAAQRQTGAGISARIGDLRQRTLAAMGGTQTEVTASVSDAHRNSIGAAGFAIVFGIVLAGLIARGISKPIRAMTDAMGHLANGKLDVVIPGVGRKDETGAMANAMKVFKDSALERQRVASQAAAMRELEEEEKKRLEAEAAAHAIATEREFIVSRFGRAVKALADGNLTIRLSEAMPGEYERLRHEFNEAVERLESAVGGVVQSSSGIAASSSEIGEASDDMSRRTEQQAAALEETAAALNEITANVRKTAKGAIHAKSVVSAAKAEAEKSGEIVQRAVAAMGGIERSSEQISKIIGVIDEIAFQTNLLALNAGVEAARAGEAGRGFAVVAQEVRGLAQRSAEAAKEIKGLISTSTSEVGNGVTLVDETGKSLTRIVERVMDIAQIVTEIAASANEQATGLEEVNVAVTQMDQVTQQNAAMAEQSNAASQSLRGEATRLSDIVARFRVTAGQSAAISPRRRAA